MSWNPACAWICGTQAGTASARRGAYYAGPGNKFWAVLHQIGLLPERFAPERFREMPRYGIGLTDVAKQSFAAGFRLCAALISTYRASTRGSPRMLHASSPSTASVRRRRPSAGGATRFAFGSPGQSFSPGLASSVLPST
ncbi:uracil-DNA glycosylase family protein, partial [Bosea thiooxidans]